MQSVGFWFNEFAPTHCVLAAVDLTYSYAINTIIVIFLLKSNDILQISFSISYGYGFAISKFSQILSEKVFISPSFLKKIFAGYRIPAWQGFFL